MFCQNCGSDVGDAAFCTRCGARQRIEGGTSGAADVVSAPPPYMPAVGGRANTTQWIGQGWELVKTDLGNFVLMTVLMLVINGALPLLLHGALTAGFQGACKKKLLGHRFDMADLFEGFHFFGSTLAANVVITILVFLGVLLFIIPGLILAAMYNFTFLFIIDKKYDYKQAMRASAAVVKQDYFGYTIFLIALGLLNLAGVLCLFVGLLVTVPVSMAAITIAYRDVVGFE